MLTPAQLEFRRKGLSATDIAPILGIDPFRTGWSVQQDKRGLPGFKGNLFSEAGLALEPIVARQYCEDNAGVTLHQGTTFQHPEFPLLLATPDYLVVRQNDERRLLEIKSVFTWPSALEWGTPETSEIPQRHVAQVQWQLGVMRCSEADVARFYGGAVQYWRVRFDASMFADLRELAHAWWEKHVVRGVELEPGAPDLDRVMEHSAPIEDKKAPPAIATSLEAQALQRWRSACFARKAAEAAENDAQAKVIRMIGSRTGLKHEKILVRYGMANAPAVTDWFGIARELGATPEDVVRHTRRGAPYRRPWASFWNEKEKDK